MLKRFLVLIFLILIIEAPSLASDIFDARKVCLANKGIWREFGNECANNCSLKRPRDKVCASNITFSCDCLKGRCWDYYRCVDEKTYITQQTKIEKERIAKIKAENPGILLDADNETQDQGTANKVIEINKNQNKKDDPSFGDKVKDAVDNFFHSDDKKPADSKVEDSKNSNKSQENKDQKTQEEQTKSQDEKTVDNNKENKKEDKKEDKNLEKSTPEKTNKDEKTQTDKNSKNAPDNSKDQKASNNPEMGCKSSGGIWKEFTSSCADTCLSKVGSAFCAETKSTSCSCQNSNKCWDGSSCVDTSKYKLPTS